MKNIIFMSVIVLVCVCCQKQNTKGGGNEEAVWKDSIEYYTEQVRQGNADAYLKLVECYHQGEEDLEQRVIKMALIGEMLEIYGVTPSFRTVFESLEDDDSVKMVYEITQLVRDHRYDKALAQGKKLERAGIPHELVEGFVAMEKNQKDEAIDIFTALERRGCRLARIFAAVLREDIEAMLVAAKDFPLLYNEIARMSMERADSIGAKSPKADIYYRKADERGCIDEQGVRFLLGYNDYLAQTGEGPFDSLEVERLKRLVKVFRR